MNLLLQHWRVMLAAVMLLGIGVQQWRVDVLRGELAREHEEGERQKMRAQILTQSLEHQNEAIRRLRDEGLKRAAAARKALASASRIRARYQRDAQRMMELRVSAEECEALRMLLDEQERMGR